MCKGGYIMSRYKYKIDKPLDMSEDVYYSITDKGNISIENIIQYLISAYSHNTPEWNFNTECLVKALCDEHGNLFIISVMDVIELFYHNETAPIVIEDITTFETKYLYMSENEEMRHGFMSNISEEYRARHFHFKDLMEIEDDYWVVGVVANAIAETFPDKPPVLFHRILVIKKNSSTAFVMGTMHFVSLLKLFNFLSDNANTKERHKEIDVVFGGRYHE